MRFSIIIPTYNEQECIEACLQSVRSQRYSGEKFELIVSDANSNDRTVEIARKYAERIVTSERRGIAHGRNEGAAAAKGDILVFIDADVVLQPDFLHSTERFFQDQRVVGFTARALPSDGNWFARFVYRGTYLLVRLFNAVGLSLFPGLCVAYRKDAFLSVHGFREDFGISEDLDLSRRISAYGKCKFDSHPHAFVSTRRLQKHALSTVLFHIYHDLRYLLTGKTASTYPKSEEIKSAMDLWRLNWREREKIHRKDAEDAEKN